MYNWSFDHTNDIYTSLGKVSLGARLIEKHVYLDKKFGPDREVSINFKQLKELVQGQEYLNNQQVIKKIYKLENPIEKWVKKLVSIKNIKKDQILKAEDFWSKRPGTGIHQDFMIILLKKSKKRNNINTLNKKYL